MTNFEKIKTYDIREVAANRIEFIEVIPWQSWWHGDFGNVSTFEEAINKEIEWLNQEYIEQPIVKENSIYNIYIED